MLVSEFDDEMRMTRELLQRVPAEHAGWAPHAKSMTLGKLSVHVATLPMWATMTVRQLVALFEAQVADARRALTEVSEVELAAPWSLKRAGATLFSLPRSAVLRTWVLNHIIHHRGQLTVSLRLKDVPLPSVYGPSADAAG